MKEFIIVQKPDIENSEPEDENQDIVIKTIPNRYKKKTRAQRQKAIRHKIEVYISYNY